MVGSELIKPLEVLDRRLAGMRQSPAGPGLAMHAGIHVEIDGTHDFVAEQLVGTFYLTLRNGLNWTPFEKFRERDRGGWDLTVPATAFRGVDANAIDEAVTRLNSIHGHPFVGEDCTAFVERSFSGRRLFADSPLCQLVGIGVRIGDPSLPLLTPAAPLDERSKTLLQFDAIVDLPPALADATSPNARLWISRLAPAVAIGLASGVLVHRYSSGSRKSRPASRTARRFFK